jgi:putative hemolysin
VIWLAILACIVISFTFSGIESGVLSVNRVRLRHFARQGEAAAQTLDRLLQRIERLMITLVLITNAANVLGVVLIYSQFQRWFGMGAGALTLVVCLPVFVVLLEFLPKAIFQRFPYRTLVIFARILMVAHWVLAPAVEVGAWLARPLFRATREPGVRSIAEIHEIKRATNESVARGRMPAVQRDLIHSVVEFRGVTAADLMAPLQDIPMVQPETTVAEALAVARETGVERLPVITASGEIAGLLQVFDLLIDGVRSGRVQSYARRAVTVQPGEPASEVLRRLRVARMPLAVVVSDGAVQGLVFNDSVIQRLLGRA